jgi:hypothetical protein
MAEDTARFRGADGVALARETIDVLSSHEIPTSPANYEIWTVHRLGGNPALSMEIEARLAAGGHGSERGIIRAVLSTCVSK